MEDRQKSRVLFLSSYPPEKDPVALFTTALVQQLQHSAQVEPRVLAVEGFQVQYLHPQVVVGTLRRSSRFSHIAAAQLISEQEVDLLVIEHSFDVYGGQYGEYLLDLTQQLQVPYVITCHSVPATPEPEQLEILSDLCYFSEGVVATSTTSKNLLAVVYHVDEDKITVIPPGVAAQPNGGGALQRLQYCPEADSLLVTTLGQLSPALGLEVGIRAVAQVAQKHPQVRYVVAGPGVPKALQQQESQYRAQLARLVETLGVQQQVQLVDTPLPLQKMEELVAGADVVMTPYPNRNTAGCPMLDSALGCGRVVISTPTLYAQEMLADGRGLLARFNDADALANCLCTVIEHPQVRQQMEENAYRFGQNMHWPRVAPRYNDWLCHCVAQAAQSWAMQA